MFKFLIDWRKVMKKYICLLLAVLMIVSCAGCGNQNVSEVNEPEQVDLENVSLPEIEKIKVVTTIFPIYDWVKELTLNTEVFDIVLLQDSGADLHNYQPSVEDLVDINESKLFIFVGGESDEWVSKALTNDNVLCLNLMEALVNFTLPEESKDGSDELPDEDEMDEHIWLSVQNAKLLCEKIKGMLQTVAPDKHDLIENNYNLYNSLLGDLDGKYKQLTENCKNKTVIFGDRFPFRYLFNDYGVDYLAAFKGCSAESEASFEVVSFLAEKVNEFKVPCIAVIDGTNTELAKTIAETAGKSDLPIVSMNSLQNITAQDVKNRVSYIDIMTSNLESLGQLLGKVGV